jgi:hypothetical protein
MLRLHRGQHVDRQTCRVYLKHIRHVEASLFRVDPSSSAYVLRERVRDFLRDEASAGAGGGALLLLPRFAVLECAHA